MEIIKKVKPSSTVKNWKIPSKELKKAIVKMETIEPKLPTVKKAKKRPRSEIVEKEKEKEVKNEGPFQGLLNDLVSEVEDEKPKDTEQVSDIDLLINTAKEAEKKNHDERKPFQIENYYNTKQLKIRNAMTNGSYIGLKDINFKEDEVLVYYLSLYLVQVIIILWLWKIVLLI